MDSPDTQTALRFITCGSVDDGKSTLIGRLLVDSKAVLQDQLAGITKSGKADLAQLTDGLQAEREQGITIDVAWRYFSTAKRKFIIGDSPGHEQYTRNMVTAASQADAAIVLVDATKLNWQNEIVTLLEQTHRHTMLLALLRVPTIIFAINKLDAINQAEIAYKNIKTALEKLSQKTDITPAAIIPISALKGWNVVDFEHKNKNWCRYGGKTLLELLEKTPTTPRHSQSLLAIPVQWVEKSGSSSSQTNQGRRIFWGRISAGHAKAGQEIQITPSGQTAKIAKVLSHTREEKQLIEAGHSAGIILDKEIDISRGDWITANTQTYKESKNITATVAWTDDEPLAIGRIYWALHGHKWTKAKIVKIIEELNINTLEKENAKEIKANSIGKIEIALQSPITAVAFTQSRLMGQMILVDTATNATAAAALIDM